MEARNEAVLDAEILAAALRESAEALTELYRQNPSRRPRVGQLHRQTIWLKQKGATEYRPFLAEFRWDGVVCAAHEAEAQARCLARALQSQFN